MSLHTGQNIPRLIPSAVQVQWRLIQFFCIYGYRSPTKSNIHIDCIRGSNKINNMQLVLLEVLVAVVAILDVADDIYDIYDYSNRHLLIVCHQYQFSELGKQCVCS